jgi:YVTN family beta-propeller protein
VAASLLGAAMGVAAAPFAYVANSVQFGPAPGVSVIDLATNTQVAQVTGIQTVPEALAFAPDGQKVYVTDRFASAVQIIDTATNAVTGTITGVGPQPNSIVVTPDGKYAYVGNAGFPPPAVVRKLDLTTNTLVDTITVGGAPDSRIEAMSPDGSTLIVSSYYLLGTYKFDLVTRTGTTFGYGMARGAVFTPDGRYAYLIGNGPGNAVSILDVAANQLVGAPIALAATPGALALTPAGDRVYAALADGTVSVIDTALNAVTGAAIPLGLGAGSSLRAAVSPDGRRLVVASWDNSVVKILDTGTQTVVASLPVSRAYGVAISPAPAIGQAAIAAARDQLGAIGPTGSATIDRLIASALAAAGRALDPALYIDATHLASGGATVFDQLASAVASLQAIQNASPALAATISAVIDGFVRGAQVLAQTAIADATSAPVGQGAVRDAHMILKANDAMASAGAAAGNGQFDRTISLYGDAWRWAQKALK